MFPFLAAGVTLGLAAGLSPGPLMALLVAQTLRHGVREGIKVAVAPVLTDAPIVAVTLLVLTRAANVDAALGAVSLAGGLYVGWLGVAGLRVREVAVGGEATSPRSVRKAVLVNLFNPHVYVFWATVGSPLLLRAARQEAGGAGAFAAAFYLLLCGSKTALAVLIGRSRGFLGGATYRRILQVLGLVLLGFGLWLVWDGVRYLVR